MRQEFKPVKGPGWTYERVRNPHSNATTEVVVHCHSATIELPIEFNAPLGEDGESRIAYLSAACKDAEGKPSPDAKTLIYEEAFMTKGAGLKTRP